jgi:hypothetical protein
VLSRDKEWVEGQAGQGGDGAGSMRGVECTGHTHGDVMVRLNTGARQCRVFGVWCLVYGVRYRPKDGCQAGWIRVWYKLRVYTLKKGMQAEHEMPTSYAGCASVWCRLKS